jgi:LmbE family N-acetylglucosaminyl deacetylase
MIAAYLPGITPLFRREGRQGRQNKPDHMLVLRWNHKDETLRQRHLIGPSSQCQSQNCRSSKGAAACVPGRVFSFPGADIKDSLEAIKCEFDPSLVLTHWQGDAHQDHRLVALLTHNTFRDHLTLGYEIPKYDGDLGNPNFFVPLTQAQFRRKVETSGRHFSSQRGRSWFSDETFLAVARLRAIECNSAEGLAEGFYVRKIVF